MKQTTKKHKNIIPFFKILIILLCTLVGGYGIVAAPESDQDALEQELAQNANALEANEKNRNHLPENRNRESEQKNGIMPTPAQTTGNSQSSISPAATTIPAESTSVIGDSVFLGAAPAYQKLVPDAVIDAKISRQVYQGLDVAKKLSKTDKLGSTVLIALGTNGKFNEVTGQELIDYLGRNRTIYWINAYGKKLSWKKEVNRTIQTLAKKNANVSVVDWAKEAKRHPNWFYQDGTHLNTKGQNGYAKFIVEKTRKPDI